jgi:hypothetical protein
MIKLDSGRGISLDLTGEACYNLGISLAKDSYSPGMRCLNAFGSNLQNLYSCAKSAISELTDSPDVFGETAEIGMLRSGALRFKGHIMASSGRGIQQWVRERHLKTNPRICERCGFSGYVEVHHKLPVCEGGGNEAGNLEVLCELCHAKAHNRTRKNFIDPTRKHWKEV